MVDGNLPIVCDLPELFEGGFEVFDDFLGENVRVRKIVGLFQAFVSQPEDIKAALSRFLDVTPYRPEQQKKVET